MQFTVIKAPEVAARLGIDVKTVYRLARTGQLPCFYPCGIPTKPHDRKPVSFYSHQIDQYIKDNSLGM